MLGFNLFAAKDPLFWSALHFDVGLFNELSKFFKILLVDFAKFFWTDIAWLASQALKLGLNIGQLDYSCQFHLKFADNVWWCASGHKNAIPGAHLKS